VGDFYLIILWKEKKMDYFKLTRDFWDYAFENPEKIKPNHCALYLFIVEHCNRLGWKSKFGLPTTMAKDAIGIRSYNTYITTLNELVDFGFIIMIEKSKNQYSSNIVALSINDKALAKALDKAFIKHDIKQSESIDSINKPINNIQENKEPIDWQALLDFLNKAVNKKYKSFPEPVKKSYRKRLKEGFTKSDIMKAIEKAAKDEFHISNEYKHLTIEFFSRADKLDKFSQGLIDTGKTNQKFMTYDN
jgi:uncharacterized phage protein (TIGR02220 family)